jgi:hypothetical protein
VNKAKVLSIPDVALPEQVINEHVKNKQEFPTQPIHKHAKLMNTSKN